MSDASSQGKASVADGGLKSAPALAGTIDLSDYDEISEVMKSRDFVQVAFPIGHSEMIPGALVTLEGRAHFERRRLESKLFSRNQIAQVKRTALVPAIERTLGELQAARAADGIVRADLVPLTWRMAHPIPAAIVGIDGVDTAAASDRFIDHVRTMARAITVDWQRDNHDELLGSGKAARDRFVEEFFEGSVEYRKALVAKHQSGELPAEALPTDLITLMLSNWRDDWEPELLLRESIFFLMASITTTALAFTHFVVYLDKWLEEHPDHKPLLQDLDFLQGAVDESLRFFVAAPARLRQATKDVVLESSGRQVKAGDKFALWFIPANSNEPGFGPDAAEFNPLRQVEGRAAWGLGFGAGAHMCIGKPLVTGVSSRWDEPGEDAAAHGSMATLAYHLFGAGLELDDERSPKLFAGTYYNEYESLPVRFSKL